MLVKSVCNNITLVCRQADSFATRGSFLIRTDGNDTSDQNHVRMSSNITHRQMCLGGSHLFQKLCGFVLLQTLQGWRRVFRVSFSLCVCVCFYQQKGHLKAKEGGGEGPPPAAFAGESSRGEKGSTLYICSCELCQGAVDMTHVTYNLQGQPHPVDHSQVCLKLSQQARQKMFAVAKVECDSTTSWIEKPQTS